MASKIFFRWLAWLLIGAVTAFTLSPVEFRPVTVAPAGLERMTAFAAIGLAFCLGYPTRRFPALVLLIGAVALLEVAQNYVPGRHGRLPDGVIKASGVVFGAALAMIMSRRPAHRRAQFSGGGRQQELDYRGELIRDSQRLKTKFTEGSIV